MRASNSLEEKIIISQTILTTKGEYIECKECGFRCKDLAAHLKRYHNMTGPEYKEKHNVKVTKCSAICDDMKGKNNPAYDHGGRLSPFSKKFLKGDISKETYAKARQSIKDNDSNNTTLEYWLKKTNGDEAEAKRMLSNRQSTFSLDKCIKKYGEINGRKRWEKRQALWLKNYKKTNFSKISQTLFKSIFKTLSAEIKRDVYFAILDADKQYDETGRNHEKMITLVNGRSIKPDFLYKNKIIEFDGDYWHNQNRPGNLHREELRDKGILESGYELLHIKESDYNADPNHWVLKCVTFLTK